MRICGLILPALLVTFSGCIVTYRDFPIVDPLPSVFEPAAPPRCRQTIQFPGGLPEGASYEETYSGGDVWSRLRAERALQAALKDYAGCSSSSPIAHNSKWAETEVVVRVIEKPNPRRYGEGQGGIVSNIWIWLTLIIPDYNGQGGWQLSYSFYDRNTVKKTYAYEITLKRFTWLLVLPFSWINFFTYSLEDAVRSTTAQFIVDAQRDGYLETKN
jgi:hypothetical protein